MFLGLDNLVEQIAQVVCLLIVSGLMQILGEISKNTVIIQYVISAVSSALATLLFHFVKTHYI